MGRKNERGGILSWGVVTTFVMVVCLPSLFREGMFFDGLTYSSVARNMAMGMGSFWSPHYTKTLLNEASEFLSVGVFYEQLPLVMWMQSWFFKILGDHFWTEKFYDLLTIVFSLILMGRIWVALRGEHFRSLSWLPVFWVTSIPLYFWTLTNNLLDGTLSVWTLFAVWLWVRRPQISVMTSLMVGLVLFLGFLSRGPVAFFPLVTPVILAWTLERSFKEAMRSSFVALGSLIVLSFFLWQWDEAQHFLKRFWESHLQASLSGGRGKDPSIYFLKVLGTELAVPLLLSLFFLWKGDVSLRQRREWRGAGWFFFLTALSASVPLFLVPQKRSFYLTPSLPFFALTFAVLSAHWFLERQRRWGRWKFSRKVAYGLPLVVFLVLLSLWGKVGRDHPLIFALKEIVTQTKPSQGAVFWMCPSEAKNWKWHAYFARYGQISLLGYTPQNRDQVQSVGAHLAYAVATPSCREELSDFPGGEVPLSSGQHMILLKRKDKI